MSKMNNRLWVNLSWLLLLLPFSAHCLDFSNVPGVVLDHQPTDYGSWWEFQTTPEVFISDPEIVVLSDGSYVASHALAGRESDSDTSGITSVFRSTDQGATWTQTATINGLLRGSLFEHGGALYLLGTKNDDGGPTVVCKSTDSGNTWTRSEFSSNGGSATPNNPVVYGGKLWSAASTASMSAPVVSNLMNSASWSKVTGFPATQDEWPGDFIGEGQIVASPELGLFILPKVKYEPLTALARVDATTGGVAFDPDHDFVSLPGGEKKFGAGYDAVSGRFFVLSNPILPAHADNGMATDMVRNTAALLSSPDLENWDVEKIFIYSSNDEEDGFGYLNFDIDGDDMVVASRTAFPVGGDDPERGHDSNLLTFHLIEDFRTATPDHVLKLSGGSVLRYEKTDYQDAPLGSFVLGATFDGAALTGPDGFGKAANGDVYIRESGGRILQFDASGNFLQTTSSAPVAFQTSELSIDPPAGGDCAWVNSGSGDWSDALNWYYWGRADTDDDVAVFGSAATSASTVSIASRNREWLFNTDGDLEDWTMANMTAGVSGGTLQGTPSTADPYIMHANQSFFGDEVATITVRMRANIGSVTLQFYWATAAENTYGGHVVTASYTGNGDYQDIVFSPTGHVDWDGQLIKKIRVDPINGSTTPFEIDSITVQTLPRVVKGLRFRNTQSYTLAGAGLLAIDADSGSGSIEAQLGDHEIQVPLGLEDDTDVLVETGASLRISGGLDLNGNTLAVYGAGDLIITNSWQMESGTLSIELGSLVTLDGTAGSLDGTLAVSAAEEFSPAAGDSFHLIAGDLGTNRFDAVTLPALEEGLGWDTSALYTSGSIAVKIAVPVSWMEDYGLPSDGSADFIDSDGDGLDNYSEWKAGTNPTNILSVFTLSGEPSAASGDAFLLRWNSLTGRTYRIDCSTNLLASFSTLTSGIPGSAEAMEFIDPGSSGRPAAFYKIIIE